MPIDLQIREYIDKKGYITIDKLMSEALTASPSSYYQNKNLIGAEGDFITSPEISQLFGETIALWCIEQWEKLGKPNEINIVELGPGRGLLMHDLLRTAKIVPEFFNSIQIDLVEVNPNFIEWQKKNLSVFNKNIKWLDRIVDIKKKPTIFIANEFFDALPIKQYIKVKETWYESILVLDPKDGKIKFDKIELHKELRLQLLNDHPQSYDGAIIEESVESLSTIKFIANQIKNFTGAGLIIDYGYYIKPLERTRYQYSPTLQAIKNHQYHPLLETLGEADLSAHVDFYNLEKTAKEHKVNFTELMSQGDFLTKYGILMRVNELKKSLSSEQAAIIARQVERLISLKQMGELFKVLYLN